MIGIKINCRLSILSHMPMHKHLIRLGLLGALGTSVGLGQAPDSVPVHGGSGDQAVRPGAPLLTPAAITVPFRLINGMLAVSAAVDGHRGLWLLDSGGPCILVNGEYLQAAADRDGLDTVRAPFVEDHALANGTAPLNIRWLSDSVAVQIGTHTLQITRGSRIPRSEMIAIAAPMTSLYAKQWGFTPLGILGFATTLGAYETIVDYARQQLTLVPLDSAGRRLVAIPAYAPVTTIPFTRASSVENGWYVEGQLGGVRDTVHIDTGENFDKLNVATLPRLGGHAVMTGQTVFDDQRQEPVLTVDQVVVAGRSFATVPFSVTPLRMDAFGTEFLRQLGAVGFNFRARQLVLYR